MQQLRPLRKSTTITGSGVSFQVIELFNGNVLGRHGGHSIRQALGGLATAYALHYIDSRFPDPASAALIDDNSRVTTATIAASVPSDTVADLNSDIDNPREFRGLKVCVDVTASTGDWTLELEDWGENI